MDWDFRQLQEALQIKGNTVRISKTEIPDLAGIVDDCYGGQPIVLSEVVPGSGDGVNETVVRQGKSSFLNRLALPVVATFKVASGAVQATLCYTLPTGWKFSDSFPN